MKGVNVMRLHFKITLKPLNNNGNGNRKEKISTISKSITNRSTYPDKTAILLVSTIDHDLGALGV